MKKILTNKYVVAPFLFLLALVSPALHAADAPAVKSGMGHERVVIQVSDDDTKKWNLTLNNANNIQQALGAANVDIEIVTYGPGVDMLKFDSVVADRVDEALKAGIKIVACQNTMKSMKLTKADMMSTIAYVPAGIAELVKKQREGYAYIRP